MSRTVSCLAVLSVLVCVAPANSAIVRTEDFSVDPGWSVVGSGLNENHFGYQPSSSFAGGSTGEGGGTFTRSNFVKYYADTHLGGTLTLDQPLSASGKLDYTDSFHADFGYTNMLGHFSKSGFGRVGIAVNYDGNANKFYWTPVIILDDFTDLSASTAFTKIGPNVDRAWSYSWDPNGGAGYGSLTTLLDGVTHTIELTAAQRAVGSTMDAFGFAGLAGPSTVSTWYADIYFDDLTCTVVPEPSAFILSLSLGAFGLFWRAYTWRKGTR